MSKQKVITYTSKPNNVQVLNHTKPNEKYIGTFKLAYWLGCIFCMIPWYSFTDHVLRRPLLHKIYATAYGLILGILLVTALLLEDERIYASYFDRVLATVSKIISISLTEFMIFGSMFLKLNVYKIYLREISAHIHDSSFGIKCLKMFHIQFILGHIVFFGTFAYTWYVWNNLFNACYINLTFLAIILSAYYCFLSAIFACNHALIVGSKYEFLNHLIVKETEYKGTNSEKQIIENILSIGKRYTKTTEFLGNFNDIFGWVTVFIFWHSIVEVLRCPSLFLKAKDDHDTFWTIFISLLLTSSISLSESIYLIWCCQSASRAGKKMVKICIKLQENFEPDSKPRNELFRLAEIARASEPRFTAANFFVITKSTMLGLINIATTYLIVIVQFNGVLHDTK